MLSEEQNRSMRADDAARVRGALPGAWGATSIAALSAGFFGYWVWTNNNTAARPSAATSRGLAEVDPADLTGALDTVASSPDQIARFRQRPDCERRLAWVTVVRSPGQPPGRIRLQSGGYLSPAFDLAETPVRVALPFPAPYPAGRGTIAVLGTTVDAIVALSPPWPVAAQPGQHAINVTWTPLSCPAAGG